MKPSTVAHREAVSSRSTSILKSPFFAIDQNSGNVNSAKHPAIEIHFVYREGDLTPRLYGKNMKYFFICNQLINRGLWKRLKKVQIFFQAL